MQSLYLALALFLLLNLAAGMWRVMYGPSAADRMLAAQLFGTTAVAILLLLAQATAVVPTIRALGRVHGLGLCSRDGSSRCRVVRRAWPESESAPDAD